jgi:hypothetical protein
MIIGPLVSFSQFRYRQLTLHLGLNAVTPYGHGLDQTRSLLDRQAEGANLDNMEAGQAAVNALLDADVPGGVAKVSGCDERVKDSIRPYDHSLRGVLNAVVSSDSRYTWEIKDDVINVIPSSGLPEFLLVRVAKFELAEVESPSEALSQLLAIPEVHQAHLSLGPRTVQGGTYVFCPGCPAKEKKTFSVTVKDVTVRDSLNAIARAHGSAVWSFRQSQCGGRRFFSLDFAAN